MIDFIEPVIVVNSQTGEVLKEYPNGAAIRSEPEQQAKVHYAKKQDEKILKEMKIAKEYSEKGNFIWNAYTMQQVFLPDLSPSATNKIVYLSTYLGYKGYLMYDNNKPVKKKDLGRLLWVSDSRARCFWKEANEANLIWESDGLVWLNPNVFDKGQIPEGRVEELRNENMRLTRFYVQGVRTLYENSTNPNNKNMAYIFKVLPFVNWKYNVCCTNPDEEDPAKVNLLQLGDFADLIGYGRGNSKALSRVLFDPMFNFNGRDECAVRYVLCKDFSPEHYSIFINPRVYYGGRNSSDVDSLNIF